MSADPIIVEIIVTMDSQGKMGMNICADGDIPKGIVPNMLHGLLARAITKLPQSPEEISAAQNAPASTARTAH